MTDTKETVLITGGTGFLGDHLIKRLLPVYNIRVVARNESKLILLKNKYSNIEIIPGDIANVVTTKQACTGISGIYHLAAFKHVRLAEQYALECINTNVVGTMNLLNETLHNKDIKFIVGISTDKVALVTGTYGATKFLMESLFRQYEAMNINTQYRLVRYGNVLYSTGSVLCLWKNKLQKGEEVIITEPNATRFYWPIEEAIELIFKCLKEAISCEPFLPEMKSMKIGDLLEAMNRKYLPEGMKFKVKTIGLQEGENLHEKLVMNGLTSNDCEKYTVDEIYNMV